MDSPWKTLPGAIGAVHLAPPHEIRNPRPKHHRLCVFHSGVERRHWNDKEEVPFLGGFQEAGGAGGTVGTRHGSGDRGDRMRYDEYLARCLPIGSGRAKAACKTVVGRRLKCTGMRWSVDGANPVLWVRGAHLSGWFDDYWDERLRQAA